MYNVYDMCVCIGMQQHSLLNLLLKLERVKLNKPCESESCSE